MRVTFPAHVIIHDLITFIHDIHLWNVLQNVAPFVFLRRHVSSGNLSAHGAEEGVRPTRPHHGNMSVLQVDERVTAERMPRNPSDLRRSDQRPTDAAGVITGEGHGVRTRTPAHRRRKITLQDETLSLAQSSVTNI